MPKTVVAQSFRIARGTLYLVSKQAAKDKALLKEVLAVLRDNPHYGHRRVAMDLKKHRHQIGRIMRKYGLQRKRKRKGKRKPNDEGNPPSGIPNRIKGLCPIHPNVIWVGDFTELWWRGVRFFLATVEDLFTREILGWSIGFHHSAQLVLDAIEDARVRRGTVPQIYHSDQGSEYQSALFRAWLLAHRVLPSHSAKASPWQNPHKESFYGRFKGELGNLNECISLDAAIERIHHRIYYYNHSRIHTALRMSPKAFLEAYVKRKREQSAR